MDTRITYLMYSYFIVNFEVQVLPTQIRNMRSRLVNYKQTLDHPTRPQACGYYEWALKPMTHCNKGKARKATRATSPINTRPFHKPMAFGNMSK